MNQPKSISPVEGYGAEEFERDVRAQFPELTPTLDEYYCQGLLHPIMGVLAEVARSAIQPSDKVFLDRLFSFIDSAIARPDSDPEIANAVQISFLEPQDFLGRKGKEAEVLMSPVIAAIVKEAV